MMLVKTWYNFLINSVDDILVEIAVLLISDEKISFQEITQF